MAEREPAALVASDPAEARRALALRLAVELLRGSDTTAGHATRAASLFEAYLRNGTVQR